MTIGKGSVEVVASIDSAIGEDASYQAYLDSITPQSTRGDETLLKLTGEPTRFVLRKNLPYEGTMTVKDRMMTYEEGKGKFNLSYQMVELRFALEGIKNPADQPPDESLVFSVDPDGYASKELIATLAEVPGLVENLIALRQKTSAQSGHLKKK